jgi:hypothetical protein
VTVRGVVVLRERAIEARATTVAPTAVPTYVFSPCRQLGALRLCVLLSWHNPYNNYRPRANFIRIGHRNRNRNNDCDRLSARARVYRWRELQRVRNLPMRPTRRLLVLVSL